MKKENLVWTVRFDLFFEGSGRFRLCNSLNSIVPVWMLWFPDLLDSPRPQSWKQTVIFWIIRYVFRSFFLRIATSYSQGTLSHSCHMHMAYAYIQCIWHMHRAYEIICILMILYSTRPYDVFYYLVLYDIMLHITSHRITLYCIACAIIMTCYIMLYYIIWSNYIDCDRLNLKLFWVWLM